MRPLLLFIFISINFWGCGNEDNSSTTPGRGLTVFGFVRDGYDDVIAEATVQIGAKVYITDNLGYFEISGLPPGEHPTSVHKAGYFPSPDSTLLLQTVDREIDFSLKKTWSLKVGISDATVLIRYNSTYNEYTQMDSNFGSIPTLSTGISSGHYGNLQSQCLIGFDMSVFPADIEILTATFSISKIYSDPSGIVLEQILGPWDEYTVTYNNCPGHQPASDLPPRFVFPPDQESASFDLGGYIKNVVLGDQFPHGIMITGGYSTFYSRESQEGEGPTLTVECIF